MADPDELAARAFRRADYDFSQLMGLPQALMSRPDRHGVRLLIAPTFALPDAALDAILSWRLGQYLLTRFYDSNVVADQRPVAGRPRWSPCVRCPRDCHRCGRRIAHVHDPEAARRARRTSLRQPRAPLPSVRGGARTQLAGRPCQRGRHPSRAVLGGGAVRHRPAKARRSADPSRRAGDRARCGPARLQAGFLEPGEARHRGSRSRDRSS